MDPFRVWRHRLLWHVFYWGAALWVVLIFLVSLPVDFVFCLIDLARVNCLKLKRSRGVPGCVIVDALTGGPCCAASRKYRNRWLLKLVCPYIGNRPLPGAPYSPCHADPKAIFPLWVRAAVIVVALIFLYRMWPREETATEEVYYEAVATADVTASSPLRHDEPLPDAAGRAREMFAAGESCLGQRDYAGARQHYEVALEYQPALAEAHYGLALSQLGLGKEKEARSSMRAGLKLKPHWPEASMLLARIELALGNLADAEVFARQARDGDAQNESALELLLQIDAAKKREAERAREVQPNPAAIEKVCRSLFEAGRFAEAKRHTEQALARQPSHVPLMVLLARCYRHTGDRNRAKAALWQILKSYPHRTDLRVQLAAWHDEDGETSRAELEYRKALSTDPNCNAARRWLAAAEREREKVQIAKASQKRETADARGGPTRTLVPTWGQRSQTRQPAESQPEPRRYLRLSHQTTRPATNQQRTAQQRTHARLLPTRLSMTAPRPVAPQPKRQPKPKRRMDVRVTVPPYAISQHCPRRAELEQAARSLAQGKWNDALRIASRLGLFGDQIHAGLVRAFKEHAQQNTRRARDEYERVLELDSSNLTARANLACLLAEATDEYERALSLAREAHRAETGNLRFADVHAWALARSGAQVEGAKALKSLAKRHRTDSLICLHLAWTHLAAGNRRGARDELVNVLSMARDQCQVKAARATLAASPRDR